MTTPFLDQLDRELAAAAGRIVSGERPRGRRASLLPALGMAAVVAAVVTAFFVGGPEAERTSDPPPSPMPSFTLPGPPEGLRDVPVYTAQAGGSLGVPSLAFQLRGAGWSNVSTKLLTVAAPVSNLAVVYGTASREQAELAARTLGINEVSPAAGAFPELREYPVIVVSGERPLFAGAVAAYRARFSAIGTDGRGVAETPLGPVQLTVTGADLCVTHASGRGCSGLEFSASGEAVITTKRGNEVTRVFGVVPDGITAVTLAGEQVPVSDNVWAHGPTEARFVDIPGLGQVRF